MTLDGDVSLRLAASAKAAYVVEAETRDFAAGRALRNGRGYGIEWCRRRPVEFVTLTVHRAPGERAPAGPFALTAEWPG